MNPARQKAAVYRDAASAIGLALGINLALGITKLLGGSWGNSYALLSDAANSLGDTVVGAAVLFALWIAQKPADADHPYGHTRAESVAGLVASLLVALSALIMAWELIRRFGSEELPSAWTLWVAAANVALKEGLFWYTRRVGRRTGSLAVQASAWDHRSDAVCSLMVFVGLAATQWGGAAFRSADLIVAVVIIAVILWAATALLYRSCRELLDVQAEEKLVDAVCDAALQIDGVRAVETLRVRKSGLEYFVDIHIEVDARLTVAEGHRIGHAVKDALLQTFVRVRDVLVHVEPFPQPAAPRRREAPHR